MTAIISLLIALLLPALQGAREKGRQIRCVNNVRQLMVLLQIYTQDYGGYLPVANGGFDYGGWIPQLAKSGSVPINSPGTRYGVSPSSVFYCPVETKGTWAAADNYRWTYAINHDLRQRAWEASDGQHGVRIDEFRGPSQTMAFSENSVYGDVLNWNAFDYGLWGDVVLPLQPFQGPAHGGKGLPFAYLDGHAGFWALVPDWSVYHVYPPGEQWPWVHKAFWGYAPSNAAFWNYSTYATYSAPYP